MTLILLSGGAEVAAAAAAAVGNSEMRTVLSRATHLRKISLMTTDMTNNTFLVITARSQDYCNIYSSVLAQHLFDPCVPSLRNLRIL